MQTAKTKHGSVFLRTEKGQRLNLCIANDHLTVKQTLEAQHLRGALGEACEHLRALQ